MFSTPACKEDVCFSPVCGQVPIWHYLQLWVKLIYKEIHIHWDLDPWHLEEVTSSRRSERTSHFPGDTVSPECFDNPPGRWELEELSQLVDPSFHLVRMHPEHCAVVSERLCDAQSHIQGCTLPARRKTRHYLRFIWRGLSIKYFKNKKGVWRSGANI